MALLVYYLSTVKSHIDDHYKDLHQQLRRCKQAPEVKYFIWACYPQVSAPLLKGVIEGVCPSRGPAEPIRSEVL